MSNTHVEQNPGPLTVQFEVVPSDPRNPDPATVGEVGREVAGVLRHEGYAVQPAYTGTRSGTVYEIGMQVIKAVHDNKELLISLAGLATPILQYLLKHREEETGKDPVGEVLTITLDDSSTVKVQIADAAHDEQLLERLILGNEALVEHITPESKIKLTVSVPARPARRRR